MVFLTVFVLLPLFFHGACFITVLLLPSFVFYVLTVFRVVTLAYAISWAYVIGDVYWEGYKAYSHRHEPLPKVAEVVVERTIFQSLASIVLPMFIIHTQVKIFQKIFAKMPSVKPAIRKWGPTFAGFALIPFLPIIDRPVEHCLDLGKEKIKEWRN